MLVSFCMFFAVTLRGLRHKHHGQHTEHERLNDTDKQLEHHYHCWQNGKLAKQARNDRDQHDPCKHIPEKTEGKREDLRQFRDQLQQADQKVHGAEERHLEHPARVEELTEISRTLRPETDHLDHDHGDQGQRRGEVQVHGDTAKKRRQDIATFFYFRRKKYTSLRNRVPFTMGRMQNTDRLKTGDQLEQVGEQYIDQYGGKPGEYGSCPLRSRGAFREVVENFQNGFHQVADTPRHQISLCALLERIPSRPCQRDNHEKYRDKQCGKCIHQIKRTESEKVLDDRLFD